MAMTTWHAVLRASLGARSKPVGWSISVAVVVTLGAVRVITGAEFAFASLGLLPVLLMTWVAGRDAGLVIAALATATWIVGDMSSGRDHTFGWIPWANGVTRFVTYGIVVALADHVRTQLSQAQELSARDPLTGLINRHALLDFGTREVDRSRRYGHAIAVVFIDLDNFKQLNDGEGHSRGDAALCATAAALRAACRSTDALARWGGDEFVLVLPEVDVASAAMAGERLSNALRLNLKAYGGVTASVGVAWFPRPDRGFAQMLHAADVVMYAAKQAGKDTFLLRAFGEPRLAD